MSRLLVTQYQAEVEKIVRYGGSKKETSIRNAFERLLNDYCKPRNYLLIPELDFKTKFNTTVFPDGTIKDAIRLEHGWWESKDQYDNLDQEIEKKFERGYPDENILFEDSQTAVLIQHSREQLRVSMGDAAALDGLISTFVDYERPEVRDFRAAIIKFKEDVPHILEALRSIIAQQEESNPQFRERRNTFLEVCRQSINPEIEIFDIHEMLIQHILTEDIFTNIFHESQFHRENNIARELSEIINTFFTGNTRRNTLKSIEHYYAVIRHRLIGTRADMTSRINDVFEKFTEENKKTSPIIERIEWMKTTSEWWWAYWNNEKLRDSLQGGINHAVAKYLLWKYEVHLEQQGKSGYSPTRFDRIISPELEHIAPTTEPEIKPHGYGNYDEEFRNQYLNCLGNYLLLSKSHNCAVGNVPFSKKLETYKHNEQQREIQTLVSENGVWNKEVIQTRKAKIVRFILEKC